MSNFKEADRIGNIGHDFVMSLLSNHNCGSNPADPIFEIDDVHKKDTGLHECVDIIERNRRTGKEVWHEVKTDAQALAGMKYTNKTTKLRNLIAPLIMDPNGNAGTGNIFMEITSNNNNDPRGFIVKMICCCQKENFSHERCYDFYLPLGEATIIDLDVADENDPSPQIIRVAMAHALCIQISAETLLDLVCNFDWRHVWKDEWREDQEKWRYRIIDGAKRNGRVARGMPVPLLDMWYPPDDLANYCNVLETVRAVDPETGEPGEIIGHFVIDYVQGIPTHPKTGTDAKINIDLRRSAEAKYYLQRREGRAG